MKRNCRYFRYVYKVYFLKIKEVLLLFDKMSITTQSLLDGTINVEYAPYAYQHPPRTLMQTAYTYAHAQGTKANVHSTNIFQFCPSRYTCGFSCVFGCDTAFVVVHTHVL